MNFNFRQITSKLSTRGWLAVGGAGLIGVIFIYALMSLASSPSYTTLLAGQSAARTAKITSALSTDGISYQLQNNGTAVAVQSSQEGQARDLLDSQGLLAGAGNGSTLEQLLGNQSLGESTAEQDEQDVSAIEQQLDNTIEDINGINSAQVLINVPDQSDTLFSGTSSQSTASVLLDDNTTLQASQIKSIADEVKDAVGNLSLSNLTITDQNGDPLWPTSAGTNASGLSAKQSAQQTYDTHEAEAADAMLSATVGPGKALVEVNANLDANQQQVSSVTYGPKTVPLNSATTNEKLDGAANAVNAAGNTATNNAAASYAGTSTAPTKYSDKTTTVTNGAPKTVSQTKIAPGTVESQTISVLVDSNVPATEIPTIKSAVENAVGYKQGRDKISIGSLPFAKVKPVAASSSSSKDLGDLKYVGIALASLLFLIFMTRMLRRREADNFAGSPTWLRELEMPRPLSELEAQSQMADLEAPTMVARLRSPVNLARQQVEELVDRDPERVAAQIRQWMTED